LKYHVTLSPVFRPILPINIYQLSL